MQGRAGAGQGYQYPGATVGGNNAKEFEQSERRQLLQRSLSRVRVIYPDICKINRGENREDDFIRELSIF